MTDKEIDKLAEAIVSKLTERQAQYDAEFLKAIKEQNADVEVTFFTPGEITKEEKLKALEDALKQAIETEDYIRAADIADQIKRLQE